MRPTCRRRLTRWGLVGITVLAGCRHSPSVGEGAPGTPPEPNVTLSRSQLADVQVALARSLEARGEAKQAAELYAEAIEKDPNRADACVRLAVLLDKEGRFEESIDWYRRAIQLQPDNASGLCNMGYSLYLQQRWAEAEQALRRAIALNPDHQRAHNNLGLVLARTGQAQEAMESFRRAGCTDADAHLNLAYELRLNGAWTEARREYERALALQPDSAPARKGLEGLEVLSAKVSQTSQAPRQAADPPPIVPASGTQQTGTPPDSVTRAAAVFTETKTPE